MKMLTHLLLLLSDQVGRIQRLLPSPWYRIILQDDQPATLWCTNYFEPLSLWKGQQSILNEINTYSLYGFAFLAHRVLSGITV